MVAVATVLLLPGDGFARQTGTVTGRVVDAAARYPLIATDVFVVGTSMHALTNQEGVYRLTNVPPGEHTIEVSRLGYGSATRTVTVTAGGTVTADFELQERAITLDELVVTGYSVTARRERTGAQAVVDRSELERMPVATADQALQGRAAGVQVRSENGQPGAGPTVRIRGIGSIDAGSTPLYIVDGVQIAADRQTGSQADTSPLAALNPRDIESIEVLKDAAATSIYGAQAANGVVLITTRRGAAGTTRFTFSSEMGTVQNLKTWDVVRGPDWVRLQMEAYANRAQDVGQTRAQGEANAIAAFGDPNEVGHYDWQGAVLRDGAIRKYNASASGGTEDTRFYLSGGYEMQEGQVVESDFDRLSFRANLDHRATEKLSILANVGLSSINQLGELTGNCQNCAFWAAPHMRPTLPIYNEDGSFNQDIAPVAYNIAAQVFIEDRVAKTRQGIGNLTANYAILPRLNFRSLWGLDFRTRRETLYQPPEQQVIGDNGSETYREVVNWNTNQVLNFTTTLGGRHNLNSLAGIEYRHESGEVFSAQGNGYPSGIFRTLNLAAIPASIGGSTFGYKLASFFGRTQYDFLNKYMVGGSLRYDGSSRFGEKFRYGLFYSVSAGWDLTQEAFMERLGFMDDLTLRVGYGTTGNSAIGDFASLTLFGAGNTYMGRPGLRPSQLGNDELTWEKSKSLNVGANWSALGGRLFGAVDVFRTDNESLLLDAFLPIDAGFEEITRNVGVVRNKGLEVELSAVPLNRDRFGWQTDFNISFLDNEIIELAEGQQNIGNDIRVGESRLIYWGARWAGVNPADGRPMWYDSAGNLTYQVRTADMQVIGSNLPTVTGGFSNTLRLGPVRLDALLQYVLGHDLRDSQHNNLMNISTVRGVRTGVMDRWQQPGDVTSVPKGYTSSSYPGTSAWTTGSDRSIYDGSYVRLKHVTLAYSVPSRLVSFAGFSEGRLYFQGVNLWTATRFPGIDPEVQEAGDTYPGAIQLMAGFELLR
jgi:TonB-linked SusC/RagA family outer membrane protein